MKEIDRIENLFRVLLGYSPALAKYEGSAKSVLRQVLRMALAEEWDKIAKGCREGSEWWQMTQDAEAAEAYAQQIRLGIVAAEEAEQEHD
jgi:hypothetical protein